MREKLGADFPPYRILGACNPAIARVALTQEPSLGLLLPCNVVVRREGGETIVSSIDAQALLSIVGNQALVELAGEVNAKLHRALHGLS